ncbi:uncharacterized protein N7503_007936 [Penicillium pulvis]|uniref:uncharacterized protein n=1 Tax=Penicillium pulvis TaxID=1562058 RepID=UPI002547B487|nr:uncharacterized protein N7503_007936 [Penicillium pulvis]KAJ5791958.1 hypothetical protein N7503_007936 [Penicillium pulvis]
MFRSLSRRTSFGYLIPRRREFYAGIGDGVENILIKFWASSGYHGSSIFIDETLGFDGHGKTFKLLLIIFINLILERQSIFAMSPCCL